MSRNPFATNLRYHKPKRIEDKRRKLDLAEALRRTKERYPKIWEALGPD